VSGLRPYQLEAVASTKQVLAHARSALLVMATGAGKSRTAVAVAEWARREYGRILWICHRGELVTQPARVFREHTGLSVEIEMAESRASQLITPDVVCASVQTLQGKRLEQWPVDRFGLIVADEAHHAISPSQRAILDYFAPAKLVGLTATPDRLDKAALGRVFDHVAYVYDIRDAIRDGYLAPITAKRVEVESLDLSEVKTRTGDLSQEELAAIMSEERHLHAVAKPTLDLAGNRPTLVFAVTVDHAKQLAEVFCRYRKGCSRHIDGTMGVEERAKVLAAFAAGEFQFLQNVAVLTEGVDLPYVACVAMARPTKSRALATQMIGRGTRLHPGKQNVLVLDFVGNSGKHQLVGPIDILGGDETDEVRAVARKLVEHNPQMPVLDALDEARTECARLEQLRQRRATAKARYSAKDVDLFGAAEHILGIQIRRGDVETPPTEEQAAKLAKHGLNTQGLDFFEAQKVCRAIRERGLQNLCTIKQARLLGRYGLRTDVSFDHARKAIDVLAANNWRMPGWLAEDPVYRAEAGR